MMTEQEKASLMRHLNYNTSPSQEGAFDTAVKAIDAINAGKSQALVVGYFPSGDPVTAGDIIEDLRLEGFIND